MAEHWDDDRRLRKATRRVLLDVDITSDSADAGYFFDMDLKFAEVSLMTSKETMSPFGMTSVCGAMGEFTASGSENRRKQSARCIPSLIASRVLSIN
jgi:hypothetical protein